jgi:hypothetical protein
MIKVVYAKGHGLHGKILFHSVRKGARTDFEFLKRCAGK